MEVKTPMQPDKTTYQKLLADPRWKERSRQVMERDGFKCRNCGNIDSLQVHHRQYHFRVIAGIHAEPWNYEDKYLITLCSSCHESGHRLYKVPVFNV